ncbi:MAG TPA: hypothetical protein VEK79_23300 [Thermoanaerobaculia bacterium]|nr:hypothetical protein [Thermoanaerobaculia bacterium]
MRGGHAFRGLFLDLLPLRRDALPLGRELLRDVRAHGLPFLVELPAQIFLGRPAFGVDALLHLALRRLALARDALFDLFRQTLTLGISGVFLTGRFFDFAACGFHALFDLETLALEPLAFRFRFGAKACRFFLGRATLCFGFCRATFRLGTKARRFFFGGATFYFRFGSMTFRIRAKACRFFLGGATFCFRFRSEPLRVRTNALGFRFRRAAFGFCARAFRLRCFFTRAPFLFEPLAFGICFRAMARRFFFDRAAFGGDAFLQLALRHLTLARQTLLAFLQLTHALRFGSGFLGGALFRARALR